ncbi:MFS transporter [Streptomyces sp. NPDC059720]|uniref:MFS transporter n=1 Tax=Streptomyces sp. NPDC059720 TaxID=3346924 RepID=UPI00367C4463
MSETAAHRDCNVLRWLGAYTSSAVGDTVYYIALSWAAVQAGTPVQAGLVTAVSAAPRALLMMGGGVITDRYGPRRVVLGSSVLRFLLVVAAAGLLLVTNPGLWALGAVALLFGTVDAVFLPAASALPARITGHGQLARVHGMRGLATRLATVLGGPLGGLGIALGGTAGAFALAALLIGGSLPLMRAVRTARETETRADSARSPQPSAPGPARLPGAARTDPASWPGVAPTDPAHSPGAAPTDPARTPRAAPPETAGAARLAPAGAAHAAGAVPAGTARRSVTAQADAPGPAGGVPGGLRDGLRHIARHRVLRPLVIATALGDLGFVGPMNLGLILLAEEKGWGSAGTGWVLAGFGAGAGAASLLLTLRGRVPRAGLVIAGGEIAGSLAIAGLAHAPSALTATAVALVVGLAAGLGGALRGALLQVTASPAHLGRVTSVATLTGFGVAPLTFPLVGAAVERWSTGPVFAVCAAICGLGALVTLCSVPLRRAELPH